MRLELKVLGPVILILLAGFLATSYSDRDSSFRFSLTGAAITDQSGSQKCSDDHILFKVSGPGNAHAELASSSNYNYAVCWDGQGSTNRQCSSTGKNVLVRLSSTTNAHVETKLGGGQYERFVCFGNLQCDTKPKGQCSTLGSSYKCVASLSGQTNAHVSNCGVYDLDLCCSDGGSTGGNETRKDTDKDTVFDEGLGATRFTPCNPKVPEHVSSKFNICADNCVSIPNTNQADEDGDGAGDVCDVFPHDSCSITLPNDNCPQLQQCKNLVAKWTVSSVYEGDPAGLVVTGSPECGGKIAHFQVFDKDNKNLLFQAPQPTTFTNATNATATSSWIGEYLVNGSNHYYFQVVVTGGSSQVQTLSPLDQLLTVNRKSPGDAVCGNGKLEGSNNETCDDGNTRNGDGCSSNCTRELINGKVCQDDPLCRGIPATFMVCKSDPTLAYFCITGPNGCKVLSSPLSCSNSNNVQKVCVRGADDCKSPTCDFHYANTPCANGQMTIQCTAKGGSNCACGSSYPKTISCTMPQQQEQFPVFTGANFVVTILLLILFYTFRRGVQWKSK